MRQGMNNESILVEYTLYLITDQSLDSSILMIFCTTIQTYFQFQLLLYHPQTFLNDITCLVESKTDDTDEILLPGYIFKMKNRKTFACQKSGGIVLGYREKFEGIRFQFD
jgi:hypothetical protein